MAIDGAKTLEIIEAMENFMAVRRPGPEIRHQLDLAYKIVDQQVIIYELRPRFDDETKIMEFDVAKATFVKSRNIWKVFWKRANGKWNGYDPALTVKTIYDFVKLVDQDEYGCFWG
jgi:hypothetical protein